MTEIFELVIVPLLAEIISDKNVSDKVKELRFNAMRELMAYLRLYQKLGYCERLLRGIAEKKGKLICSISGKTEMAKLMKPHCPHYDGSKFIPDPYCIPEEELICWGETSLKAPLNDIGYQRCAELFRQVFPDDVKDVFGE